MGGGSLPRGLENASRIGATPGPGHGHLDATRQTRLLAQVLILEALTP